MAVIEEKQNISPRQPSEVPLKPAEGLVLEADYAEDRPISLLAERQREFQRAMQNQFVDEEMPAA